MAMFNRLGSMLRMNSSSGSGSGSAIPQMWNGIRSMSSMKLFIRGLDYGINEHSLRIAFSTYGEVVEAKVITERATGRSRGFGFVSFTDTKSATSALNALHGKPLKGRIIRISYADEDKPPRPRFGANSVGDDGGY